MASLLKNILKNSGIKGFNIAKDGVYGDVKGYIDTGSYSLNAAVSGSIFKGFPSNKLAVLAGVSSTGKTYLVLQSAKAFLDKNSANVVYYLDTEGAITQDMLISRDIDLERFVVMPTNTVEECTTIIINVLNGYEKAMKDDGISLDEPHMLLCLDSLGNLSTEKEMNDSTAGESTRDMTRAQKVRAMFRTTSVRISQLNVPILITNHTYASMSQYAPAEMAGGGGLQYNADTIIFLSRAQEKEDKTVVGYVLTATIEKSRFTKTKSKAFTRLFFTTGLDRYYGLVSLGLDTGVFTKESTKVRLPDGTTAFEKHIYNNPEKYFTTDVLNSLDLAAQKLYCFGQDEITQNIDTEEEDEE